MILLQYLVASALVVIVLYLGALVFEAFVGFFRGDQRKTESDRAGGVISDTDRTRTTGHVVGMMGGSIEEGFVVARAIDEFERKHGRKATQNEIVTIAAMARSIQ